MEQFARITRMVGSSWIECLQNKKVAVFGLGGVGSYVVEALVRNGIGELVLVDHDIIDITNLNRQLYALHSTIGMNKVNVAKARFLVFILNQKITTYQRFIYQIKEWKLFLKIVILWLMQLILLRLNWR